MHLLDEATKLGKTSSLGRNKPTKHLLLHLVLEACHVHRRDSSVLRDFFRRRGGLIAGEEVVEPLQQMILSSIAAVSEGANVSEFWSNLVVAGGNSKLNNFKERLLSELESMETGLDMKDKLKLESPSGDAAEAVWLGRSVLSSLGLTITG